LVFVIIFFGAAIQRGHAQAQNQLINHTDDYSFRISGYYWYVSPSGEITKFPSGNGEFPFKAADGLTNFSSFYGEADWRFSERSHILLNVRPNVTSGTSVLKETIYFQGDTFPVGTPVTTKLTDITIAPGFEYDFIRNERGHLGVLGQLNFLDFKSSIAGVAAVTNPGGPPVVETVIDSKSLFVPLPALGVEGKIFVSRRLYADGYFQGGYFFGYGTSYGLKGEIGFKTLRHLDIKAGYLLGQRTSIHGTTNNTHLDLNDTGPIVGLQYSF
jgi:hypothetical protein